MSPRVVAQTLPTHVASIASHQEHHLDLIDSDGAFTFPICAASIASHQEHHLDRSTVADLAPDTLSVRLDGKGRKIRTCPLWSRTAEVLRALLGPRIDGPREAPIFLNVHGRPITRYGIHGLVVRIANKAAETVSSLRDKHVSPHTVRHATAVHLLRAAISTRSARQCLP